MSRWKGETLLKFKEMYIDPNIKIADIATHFNISINRVYDIGAEHHIKRPKNIQIESRRNKECYMTEEQRQATIKRILLKATGIYLNNE